MQTRKEVYATDVFILEYNPTGKKKDFESQTQPFSKEKSHQGDKHYKLKRKSKH